MYAQYLDSIEAYANGIAAAIDGQTYQVRRITPRTSGSVLDSKPIGSVYAKITRSTSKALFENQTFDALIYEAEVDWRPLVLGDVLTEVGQKSDGASYVYAQHRITNQAFWARAEHVATISRPNAEIVDDPAVELESGWQWSQSTPGNDDYAGRTDATDAVLSLTNGVYSFGSGTAAKVPVGITPIARVSDSTGKDFAENAARTRFIMYVPPLPGIELQRIDRIDCGDVSYDVVMAFTNTVGLVGSACVIEQDDTP